MPSQTESHTTAQEASTPQPTSTRLPPPTAEALQPSQPLDEGPPLTSSNIRTLATVAIVLCVIALLPGVFADYLSSTLLVPPHNHNKRRVKAPSLHRYKRAEVLFRGDKGVALTGWLYQARRKSRHLTFLLHDFGHDHKQVKSWAEDILRGGSDVFVYDQRGHGLSPHKIGRDPYRQAKDLRHAYKYLQRLYPRRWQSKVAAIGIGIGGAAVLLTATRSYQFKTIVAVNAVFDLEAYDQSKLQAYPSLFRSLTLKRIYRLTNVRYQDQNVFKRAYRARQAEILLLSTKSVAHQHQSRTFCNKTKGKCRVLYIPLKALPKPKRTKKGKKQATPSLWSRLERTPKGTVVQFVLEGLGLRKPAKKAPKRRVRRRRAKKRQVYRQARRPKKERVKAFVAGGRVVLKRTTLIPPRTAPRKTKPRKPRQAVKARARAKAPTPTRKVAKRPAPHPENRPTLFRLAPRAPQWKGQIRAVQGTPTVRSAALLHPQPQPKAVVPSVVASPQQAPPSSHPARRSPSTRPTSRP